MTTIMIRGFERSRCGTYVIWTDRRGLDHSTALDLLLERCQVGTYDLTAEDAQTFIQAHHKHMAERDLSQNVEGALCQLGAEP